MLPVSIGGRVPAIPPQSFSGDFLESAVLIVGLAFVVAVLGARGIAGLSMEIARNLIIGFVVLAVVSLLL